MNKDLEIKEKAIKRIKYYQKEAERHMKHRGMCDDANFPIRPDDCEYWHECDDPFYSYCYGVIVYKAKIEALMSFFGFTKEDLK